jgi:hypothetical protein
MAGQPSGDTVSRLELEVGDAAMRALVAGDLPPGLSESSGAYHLGTHGRIEAATGPHEQASIGPYRQVPPESDASGRLLGAASLQDLEKLTWRTRDESMTSSHDQPPLWRHVTRRWFPGVGNLNPGASRSGSPDSSTTSSGHTLQRLGALAARPRRRFDSARASARASFHAPWRTSSRASVAHFTTWNGSATRTAFGRSSRRWCR